jgi:hypothetical protein
MRADVALSVGGAVCGSVGAEAARLIQGAGVTPVSLDALIAGGVHGREVRVGDNDFVPELFEVAGDPLALG